MKRTLIFAVLSVFAVLGVFVVVEISIPLPEAGGDLGATLPAPTAKAIDTLLSLTSLFITLALAIFGGIGFFLKGFLQAELSLANEDCLLLSAAGVAGLFSIFAGHLTYTNLIRMLSNSIAPLDSAAIVWPVRIQYVALTLSLVLFFACIFRASMARLAVANSTQGHALPVPAAPSVEAKPPGL